MRANRHRKRARRRKLAFWHKLLRRGRYPSWRMPDFDLARAQIAMIAPRYL
jgi:hypothetical protein